MKNMFSCHRIDIRYEKEQVFLQKGQIFGFKMVKGKILQSETIYAFQCLTTYFREIKDKLGPISKPNCE